MSEAPPQILSIQSHVAFGYVGNRAAAFPLQRLGFDVHVVNTVQFSNHTGYGAWTGAVFEPNHISDVINGIEARGGLDRCSAVLSGYLGDAALGEVIIEAANRVKRNNRDALYVCDPVMGDVGRGFFVRPGIPEFMRERLVPNADVITPNQFELSALTGIEAGTLDRVLEAAAAARALGPRVVVVTSVERDDSSRNNIEMLLDTAEGSWLVSTPRLPLDPSPNGAGDCTSALLLAEYLKTGSWTQALEGAAGAIYAIFKKTYEIGTRELAIIAAQDDLLDPPERFQIKQIR